MEESGEHKPDFLALAVGEDDRGLQDAPDVMGDDSELEGEPDFLLALAPGILVEFYARVMIGKIRCNRM